MTNFYQQQTEIFLKFFSLEIVTRFKDYPNASFIDVLKSFQEEARERGILIEFILPELIYFTLGLNEI